MTRLQSVLTKTPPVSFQQSSRQVSTSMCPAPAPTDDTTVTLGIMRDIVTEVARRGVKVGQSCCWLFDENKKGNKKAIKSFTMTGMTYLPPGCYICLPFLSFPIYSIKFNKIIDNLAKT